MQKRSVPQAVFDSPEATKAAQRGHREACDELARTPRHMLDEGNPNHPSYDLQLFGMPADAFLARQYF